MALDKVAKKIWCEALRSGEFKKGTGALYYSGTYCCLGVAREIFPALQAEECQDYLTKESLELLGLSNREQRKLAAMNDDVQKGLLEEKYTFEDIADYIEKNL